MSDDYESQRRIMHDALNLQGTRILYKMDVAIDYLQRRPFEVN